MGTSCRMRKVLSSPLPTIADALSAVVDGVVAQSRLPWVVPWEVRKVVSKIVRRVVLRMVLRVVPWGLPWVVPWGLPRGGRHIQ